MQHTVQVTTANNHNIIHNKRFIMENNLNDKKKYENEGVKYESLTQPMYIVHTLRLIVNDLFGEKQKKIKTQKTNKQNKSTSSQLYQ